MAGRAAPAALRRFSNWLKSPLRNASRRYKRGGDCARLTAAPSLIIEVKERLILAVVHLRNDHGAAENDSKLILPQGRLFHPRLPGRREVVLEITFGIELVIADKIVC